MTLFPIDGGCYLRIPACWTAFVYEDRRYRRDAAGRWIRGVTAKAQP